MISGDADREDIVPNNYYLNIKVYDTIDTNLYDTATVSVDIYVSEILVGFAGNSLRSMDTGDIDSCTHIVGQKVQTQLVIHGAFGVTKMAVSYNWAITGGKPIKSYTKTTSKGTVTELSEDDMDDQTLSYYNTSRDTSQIVSCTFDFMGETYAENVSIFIEQPTVETYQSYYANYPNKAKTVGVRKLHDTDAYPRLMLGGIENGCKTYNSDGSLKDDGFRHGITFAADVSGPKGQIALTQHLSAL